MTQQPARYVNPAHAVRGPKYSQKKGKTPVLDREEARALLAAIDTGSLTGRAGPGASTS